MSKYTMIDLQAKIEWESGFVGALTYGIGHMDVPRDIRITWMKAESLCRQLEEVETEIMAIIDTSVIVDTE